MAHGDITINVKTLDNTTHQLQLAHDAPVPLIKALGMPGSLPIIVLVILQILVIIRFAFQPYSINNALVDRRERVCARQPSTAFLLSE